MTITDIFAEFTPGSQGFCMAVEIHCPGLEISRDEIARIGQAATDADDFTRIWENEDWWADDAA